MSAASGPQAESWASWSQRCASSGGSHRRPSRGPLRPVTYGMLERDGASLVLVDAAVPRGLYDACGLHVPRRQLVCERRPSRPLRVHGLLQLPGRDLHLGSSLRRARTHRSCEPVPPARWRHRQRWCRRGRGRGHRSGGARPVGVWRRRARARGGMRQRGPCGEHLPERGVRRGDRPLQPGLHPRPHPVHAVRQRLGRSRRSLRRHELRRRGVVRRRRAGRADRAAGLHRGLPHRVLELLGVWRRHDHAARDV